jgi:hypothetical protein
MEQIEKKLEDITRKEWVAYRWVEMPPIYGDDDERMFRTAGKRTPSEALQALEEWEVTAEDRDCVEDEPEPEKGSVH